MSLRDELAQVLDKHRMHPTNVVCLGCDWEALTADDPSFLNHQADAVIAHLALTEERSYPHGNQLPWRQARRYVTPWEDA